jgi:hypothetical protein
MKSTNNPLCTHSSGNGPSNNHRLVVWMSSFPLGLIWVEVHSGLGPSFLVVPPRPLNYPCHICRIMGHKLMNSPRFGKMETMFKNRGKTM